MAMQMTDVGPRARARQGSRGLRGRIERKQEPRRSRARRSGEGEGLARFLGWFSVGLGATQLVAPRALARAIGVADNPLATLVMRACGARELAVGLGLVSRSDPTSWVQARVAGDVLDLVLLGSALRSDNPQRGRASAAFAAAAGVTILDVICAQRLRRNHRAAGRRAVIDGALPIATSLVVNRPSEECYRYWHDFENFPRFMKHVDSVQVIGDGRSHWVASPAGKRVEWDAEIIEDRPGQWIAWRSLEGSDIEMWGAVRFERTPGDRGTIVRVEMLYTPSVGPLGALAAKLLGKEPEREVREDLRRFKQLVETGEISTTHGQAAGHRSLLARTFKRGGVS